MALNVKGEEVRRLAFELAELTGETVTVAVTEALCGRLARVRRDQGDGLADRLLGIGGDCAAHMRGARVDDGALLYDERGLPG